MNDLNWLSQVNGFIIMAHDALTRAQDNLPREDDEVFADCYLVEQLGRAAHYASRAANLILENPSARKDDPDECDGMPSIR
jgi:hypothetical protein